MEERFLGQLLVTGVPGPELDSETAARFKQLQPGGYILFGRNMKSPEQLRRLMDDLRDLSEVEPVITLDQEGGRVSRLRMIGHEPPNVQQIRETGNPELFTRHGRLTGQLLRQMGFNVDLAPVLDVSFQEDEENSLKGRCFGRTPDEVSANARLFTEAMRKEGVLSCGKHFPGYSAATVDPHHALPVIEKSVDEMENWELRPFREMLDQMDSLMVAHSYYPCWDSDRPRWPASLSTNVIRKLLREEMGFDRLLMTDDLDMGAILNEVRFEDTVRHALEATNDMIMICHRGEMVTAAWEQFKTIPEPILDAALGRVQQLKAQMAPPYDWSLERFQEINEEIWRLRVDTLGEERARILSVENAKRSPVEVY